MSRLPYTWRGTAYSLFLGAVAVAAQPGPGAAQTDARVLEIIDEVDRLMRGESSTGRMRMEIDTENWSRTLEMRIWSLGTEYSLIRVDSPQREAGTATLKVDNEVWNYLPRADRTIRIPPSMMLGAWMGSHFTNDDLVKESRIIEDYDIVISFEGDRDGEEVWEFTMTPKPEAPVIWGRIEQRIRKRDRMPIWARYYDEDGTCCPAPSPSRISDPLGGRTGAGAHGDRARRRRRAHGRDLPRAGVRRGAGARTSSACATCGRADDGVSAAAQDDGTGRRVGGGPPA